VTQLDLAIRGGTIMTASDEFRAEGLSMKPKPVHSPTDKVWSAISSQFRVMMDLWNVGFRGLERTSFGRGSMSAFDPGCVKTQTLNFRVEFPSRFRRCRNQSHWWLLLEEGN
jgi:hypothetical protein